MIIKTRLGQPIADYSVDGCATTTHFYLISIANRPYRVIYTRYPYNYLKRFISRLQKDKMKRVPRLWVIDILSSYACFPSSFFSIQPIYTRLSNNERTKPLTKSRIRETIAVLESYYVSSALFPLF